MTNLQENWKDVSGYEGLYKISDLGNVLSCAKTWKSGAKSRIVKSKPPTLLKQMINRYGYYYVNLLKHGKNKKRTIHTLVAIHHLSNPGNKPFVNHKHGNKSQNEAVNLEWCTQSENELHAFRTGLKSATRGEKSTSCKLSAEDVANIKILFSESNKTHKEISLMFNVSRRHVGDIINGKKRKYD